MTPERWQRIKALLESALERAPRERAAFLKEACAADSSLQNQVESLIASHEQAGGFIESPAFELMAESLQDQTKSLAGQSFGPYQIFRPLGSGGMGEVYLAEDTRLGRKVALKVLPAQFTREEERIRRFQQEARAASALNHPNIITIYEIGEIDSLHFIATEFIEGETLRRHLAGKQMKISEALQVATKVASALCAAHEAGIVHRDIKPENIILRTDRIVKVVDFGLVKLTEQKSDVAESPTLVKTTPGMVMGTAQYMSPEQARGLSIDARTDIWSLGVVLYEMIGGRVPFEGATSSDVIAAILDREPVTLARYSPEVPTELEWIVKKALRKDKEERYQTARELLTDLRSLRRKLEFQQELERSMDSGPKRADSGRDSGYVSAEANRAGLDSRGQRSRQVIDSLAVLPLSNQTADPGMEYFSDGITESMINALSRLPELRVMAWSIVSRYKGKEIDPREAGRELDVRAVFTGRVTQSGSRLVIKTELVDATDGSHLWGEQYSCRPSEILDVEAEISTRLSEKLLLRLTTEERKRLTTRYTDNVEAYHLYLKGRYYWNKRSEAAVHKAVDSFNQAIEIDPNYAPAYAGLADCYTKLGDVGVTVMIPGEAFAHAHAAASRALTIDSSLAEVHATLGHLDMHLFQWADAERHLKHAIELNPNYATAHQWYAHYMAFHRRFDEALEKIGAAIKLDPLSLPIAGSMGEFLYFARRNDEAIEEFRKTLEMDPDFLPSRIGLGRAYEQTSMFSEAEDQFVKARQIAGESIDALAALGHMYAMSGNSGSALEVLAQLTELSKERYVSPYHIALIRAALGETDEAFRWLEKAHDERVEWMIYANVDPRLDPLRGDPRFPDLMRRIGFVPTDGYRDTFSSERQKTETAKDQADTLSTPASPYQSWREAKIFLAVAAIIFIAGLGYFLLRPFRGTKETSSPKNFTFTQLTDQPGPEFFPSLSPDGKSVAYASRTSGNWDIYLQRVGGRNPINLTKDSPADDTQPAFSPDGERIAFRSEREGGGIFLMGATGESVIRVSDLGYSPSWSPDGGQILVGTEKIPQPSTRPSTSQLWMIDVNNGQRRMISEGDALQPNWSPHKERIAYWSRPSRAGQREAIWTIPAGGGEAVAVTDGATSDLNPLWSPDGKYLYFSSSRGGSPNIWRVAIDEKSGATMGHPEAVTTIGAATSALHLSFSRDGRRLAYIAQENIRNLRKVVFDPSAGKIAGEPVAITRGSLQLWFPDASPDGEWLTACSRGQQRHLFIIRTDGTDLRDLTDDSYNHDGWPRWSPDGRRIAFTSRRSGNYELWAINRDGSGLQQLTQANGAHYSPWSPDGSMIAYSIHTPKNDCVIINPDKAWNEQKLTYLPELSDPSLSFEGWSWSSDGKKLAGVKHLPNGVHSGIGIYDLETKTYDWLTDFGDWPVWFSDNRRLLFVSQGKIFFYDTATRKYQPVLSVTDQDVDIGSPALSRDNRTIYFTYVAAEADIWLMTLE
jgi:eukaryotic-like serine/threonine-protein kinase